MDSRSLNSALGRLDDAAAAPELWSEVLPLVADALGAVGAACFSRNDQTEGVEWAYIHGPASNHRYVEHYAALDPYGEGLRRSRQQRWLPIAECVPAPVLSRSEWYNDFIKPCGLAEVFGACVHRAGSRRVYFGIHYARVEDMPTQDAQTRQLLQRVKAAAGVWHHHRMVSLDASLGAWTIDRHPDALFVVTDVGRILQMNAAAEQLLSCHGALAVEHGRLVAADVSSARQLTALLAAAAADASERRLLLGSTESGHGHLLTAFLLPNVGQSVGPNTSRVVVRVTDLFADRPGATNLQQIFGLTPAENRLAEALLQGKTLQDMTAEFGVSMPTLRVQVRSVFRKCGVKRQVDLVRVLLRVR